MAWRSRDDVGIARLVEREKRISKAREGVTSKAPHHRLIHVNSEKAAPPHRPTARRTREIYTYAWDTASTEQKPEDNTTDGTPPDEAALQ